jgi:hypothetical protein
MLVIPSRYTSSLYNDRLFLREYMRNRPPKDIMSTEDVCGYKRSYFSRTNRVTSNPPQYYIHGITIKDDPNYSKPKGLPKGIEDNFLLKTADIPGATASWVDPDARVVREVRNITSVAGMFISMLFCCKFD